jgi:hypothetical protein
MNIQLTSDPSGTPTGPYATVPERVEGQGIDSAARTDRHDTEDTLVRPDQLTFTVVSATNRQPLGKRFWLSGAGELQTETAVPLASGEVAVAHAASIAAFAQWLDRLEAHQAVLYGIPSTPTARVVTRECLDAIPATERQGVIARTREHLQFAQAPGCMMLDFDVSGAPERILAAVALPDQVRDLLVKAVPELASAPMVWRPSSSSYLYDSDKEVRGLRGQRVYLAVARAADIPQLGHLLYERLWLLGYGYFVVSASGQLLDRTLLDGAVWQPERLDFAAGPTCVPPLERRVPSARIWNGEAPFFDARSATGLTAEEQRQIKAKRDAERMAKRNEARARREQWTLERGKVIAARAGVSEEVAAGIAKDAAEHRVLRPDFLLVTEAGTTVAVAELLASPEKWHGQRFADPLEPDYRADRRIAWANLRPATGRPYLYSHAHGGTRYTLSDGRPTIRLVPGDLPRIVDECTDVILTEGEVYQLKDQLVRVTDQGRLAPVEPDWAVDYLQRHAEFERLQAKGWRRTDLPLNYARTILAKRGEMGLRELGAIVPGPFLRPDGSVVDQPGYDDATQVLYRPTGPSGTSVRPHVTPAMAEDVLRRLWAPFSKFPFAGDIDRGCVLALLLTAALRAGIPTSPGGLIESHEAGSGKTLCAQAIANLTGVPAVPQALSQYEEETKKSLFSAARAGVPCVLYDNVGRDRALDSASLAMVLTSGTLADRILGESTYVTLPFRSLLLFTGNNTRIVGDLNRRLLRVRITPNVENPWRRVFPFCPRARTEATWLGLRVSALELVLAALAAGPVSLEGGSGYPEWDRLVRATVCWVAKNLDIGVSFADPARSLLAGYEDDPERDRLRRLLVSWRTIFGDVPVTVREAAETTDPASLPPVTPAGPLDSREEAVRQLEEVLGEIDRQRSTHTIGIYLDQQEGRIVEGLALVKAGKQGGSNRWIVRRESDHGSAPEGSRQPAIARTAAVAERTPGTGEGGV